MNLRNRWLTKSLLASTLLVGLVLNTGCDPEAPPTNGGVPDSTVTPGTGEFPTTPEPELGGIGTEVGEVETTATPGGTVAEKIAHLTGKYPIEINGDWTMESLDVLGDVLRVYDAKPEVLTNLREIRMIDQKDASLSNERLLANFQGVDCQKSGVTRSQCWQQPTQENNPLGGAIGVFGNSLDPDLGQQQVAVDTIQHELGHYSSTAVAKDEAWRTEWRDEGLMQYTVSDYGNASTEEHYAELWSKMYTEASKPINDVEWSSAGARPRADFIRVGITDELNTIAGGVVSAPVRAGLLNAR